MTKLSLACQSWDKPHWDEPRPLCCLVHSPIILDALPLSLNPSLPPLLPLCPSFPHVDPGTVKCCYSIIPDRPFSLFSPFHPSLPPAFLSRSSSVSVLRPALITHNPPHPLHPPDDVWAAFSAQRNLKFMLMNGDLTSHQDKQVKDAKGGVECLTQTCLRVMDRSWTTVQAWMFCACVCRFMRFTSFISSVIPLIPQLLSIFPDIFLCIWLNN